jgi:hypothetical protein
MGVETKFIKPAHKDLIVRFPDTYAVLPADGMIVPWIGKEGRFWRRRFNDGSVIITKPKKEEKKKEEKKSFFGGKE